VRDSAAFLIVISACVALWIAAKHQPPPASYSCPGDDPRCSVTDDIFTPAPAANQKLPECLPPPAAPPLPACQPGGSGRCRYEPSSGLTAAGPPCVMHRPDPPPPLLVRLDPPQPLPWWRKAPVLRLPTPQWLPQEPPRSESFHGTIVTTTSLLPPPLIARPLEDLPPCRPAAAPPCRI
jgi:hypothetical protein